MTQWVSRERERGREREGERGERERERGRERDGGRDGGRDGAILAQAISLERHIASACVEGFLCLFVVVSS